MLIKYKNNQSQQLYNSRRFRKIRYPKIKIKLYRKKSFLYQRRQLDEYCLLSYRKKSNVEHKSKYNLVQIKSQSDLVFITL